MNRPSLVNRRIPLLIASGALLVVGILANHAAQQPSLSAALLAAGAIAAGSDIAVRAWHALRTRHVSIELLVTIATVGALLIGEFVEASAVTFLFLLGAHLEDRTLGRTRQALKDLLDTAPETALVLHDDVWEEMPAYAVETDATVRVRAGDRVPVDGVVLSGRSTVDEHSITGEPLPSEKVRGSTVFAGTINRTGTLDVRATGIGADTTLARIIRRVEEAQEAQVPAQRFIERFARWYTPAMMLFSAGAYLVTRDVHLALTLLVIACPGALVIATPVAVAAGIGRAARQGVLIKGGAHLESIGQVSAVVLDKTGTLTEGRPRLTDVVPGAPAMRTPILDHPCNNNAADDPQGEQLLCWAAIAEADSSHPLGEPILEAVQSLGPVPRSDASEAVAGQGVQAQWQNRVIRVGRPEWLAALGIDVPSDASEAVTRLQNEGKSTAVVAVDDRVQGVIGIADSPRSEAAGVMRQLSALGIRRVVLATGDGHRPAEAIARQAGIEEVHARQLPEDKLALIRRLQEEGHTVAFVGDGINDAPALAAADVGIAMGGGGTDVAVESADIALMSDDLDRIPLALRLSRKTMRIVRQNMAIAVGTVIVLLAAVLAGTVHMGGGMLVHEASLFVVVLNSLRLLRS